MGSYISKLVTSYDSARGFKRKIQDVDDEDVDYDSFLHVEKKRKLVSTTDYIYKTLFLDGKESDVVVSALGKEWKLHKVYLCQSPYFDSMFSGNWKEANEPYINIEILDENIDIEALNLMFGSFYRNDLMLEPSQVIPLLATAVLLQMDSIIEHCTEVIAETINVQTVVRYHNAASRYGIVDVEKACKDWLLQNLLTHVIDHPKTLQLISPDLMHELLSSPFLFVMQTEYSIYVMLKAWVFLQLSPAWNESQDGIYSDAHKYFKERKDAGYFLENEGREFASVFSALRLHHLMYHYVDVEMLFLDKIIPLAWLQPAALKQWYSMLLIHEKSDKGPVDVSDEEFNKSCSRCGRILKKGGQHIWRWTGYNFGLDLVMTHNGLMLKLKRNELGENAANVGQPYHRHIMYRMTIASLNDQKQATYLQTTGIQKLALVRNEDNRLMTLDPHVKYPLLLSVNFLIVTPTYHSEIEDVLVENREILNI